MSSKVDLIATRNKMLEIQISQITQQVATEVSMYFPNNWNQTQSSCKCYYYRREFRKT